MTGGVKKKRKKNWDQTESEEKYWKIKSWKLENERAKYDTERQEKHEKQKGYAQDCESTKLAQIFSNFVARVPIYKYDIAGSELDTTNQMSYFALPSEALCL